MNIFRKIISFFRKKKTNYPLNHNPYLYRSGSNSFNFYKNSPRIK